MAVEPLADEVETYDAPAHGDPAHLLMRESFVEKTRLLVAGAESAAERARLERARAMHAAHLAAND